VCLCERERERDLKFSGFHGDGDADEDNAEHGNGSVSLPVLGTTVRATGHTPHLGPEIAVSMAVIAAATAHFFRFRFGMIENLKPYSLAHSLFGIDARTKE